MLWTGVFASERWFLFLHFCVSKPLKPPYPPTTVVKGAKKHHTLLHKIHSAHLTHHISGKKTNAMSTKKGAPGRLWLAVQGRDDGGPLVRPGQNNHTPMEEAAEDKNGEFVYDMLLYARDINGKEATAGFTPLHIAAHSGHAQCTALLLKRGADVEATDVDGDTPLHIAVGVNNREVVVLLLRHGASVAAVNNRGFTPLHFAAAVEGCEDNVGLLLDHGANINAKEATTGFTPLHIAARHEHAQCAALLLKRGADVEAADVDGDTPLHIAVRESSCEVVVLLLRHGADVEVADRDGDTPLHLAAMDGREDNVRLLLDHGANINAMDGHGNTPLHLSLAEPTPGWTPNNPEGGVNRLLIERGADPSIKNNQGNTPMHLAILAGNEEAMRLLKGADPKNGCYLHFACKHGMTAAVGLLIAWGADPMTILYANTPLHVAAQHGQPAAARLLLGLGADVEVANNDGNTPLHVATLHGLDQMATLLMDHGCSVEVANNDGNTPLAVAVLHTAEHTNNPQAAHRVIALLLRNGANPTVSLPRLWESHITPPKQALDMVALADRLAPDPDTVCPVCMCPYTNPPDWTKDPQPYIRLARPPCMHLFHKCCLDRATQARNKCPLCNGPC